MKDPPPQPGQRLFEPRARHTTPLSRHFSESLNFLGAPKSCVVFGRFCSKFFLSVVRVFFLVAMACRGRPTPVQRGRGRGGVLRGRYPSATDDFDLGLPGSQHFDEGFDEGVQRGRPVPRVDASRGCGRSRGSSLRAGGGAARDYGPGGAGFADLADSTGPSGPHTQVSDHSNLGFTGFGRGTENSRDVGRGQG